MTFMVGYVHFFWCISAAFWCISAPVCIFSLAALYLWEGGRRYGRERQVIRFRFTG
jgi:hypothetical protein